MMHGLQIKVAAQRKALDRLESELKQVREDQIGRTIRQRPYFQAKRELQTLEAIRERLHERLLQAELEAALAADRASKIYTK